MVHRSVTCPFRTLPATTTFNAAVFLVMRLVSREPPPGVSMAAVLYLLARQAVHAGAHKLARFAYNKLQTMVLPADWQREVDVQSLLVRCARAAAQPGCGGMHAWRVAWLLSLQSRGRSAHARLLLPAGQPAGREPVLSPASPPLPPLPGPRPQGAALLGRRGAAALLLPLRRHLRAAQPAGRPLQRLWLRHHSLLRHL
jgi:hypothetical protein